MPSVPLSCLVASTAASGYNSDGGTGEGNDGGDRGWWSMGLKDYVRAEKTKDAREKTIEKADYSIKDLTSIADIEEASAEDLAQLPHALKSFYTWMMASPTKKSSKNYTDGLIRLNTLHSKSIKAMTDDRYISFVKGTQENRKCNSLLSASLNKFRLFLSQRPGGASGPWEETASPSETLFQIRVGERQVAFRPVKKGDVCAMFGAPPQIVASTTGDVGDNRVSIQSPTTSQISPTTPSSAQKRSRQESISGEGIVTETEPRSPSKKAATTSVAGASVTPLKSGGVTATAGTPPKTTGSTLTPEQLARIEANRQVALARQQGLTPEQQAKVAANRQAALARKAAAAVATAAVAM
eukprot:TRINITY_DN48851_c0_g1_i1.p1 TRINITY_DN48851_c0_g1~~TRINITY_DN48851_c0_g1_i1.p1  ORF type:complete len:367 (-),score=70.80 TRINITY_DN48851_c0_g1_i1:144-1205(-)